MPSPADHDKLPYRLTQILRRLNEGQSLEARALAEEFNVNLRTIQRDLNERFSFLPLERMDSGLRLNPQYLGKLSFRDIERFACLAGIQHLYPVLSTDFLRDLLKGRLESALLVKGHNYDDLGDKKQLFLDLEKAILQRKSVGFIYSKAEGEKTYDGIEPYKLINHSGIWYLACMDGDRLKAFSVTKIDRLLVLNSVFEPLPHIEKLLQEEDSIWLNQEKSEVVLKVAKEAAGYISGAASSFPGRCWRRSWRMAGSSFRGGLRIRIRFC